MGRRVAYGTVLGLIILGAALYWGRLHSRPAGPPAAAAAGATTPGVTRKLPTLVLDNLPATPQALAAQIKPEDRLKYRLSNTTATVDQLMRKDHAILLENALIDTDLPTGLPIPSALRAPANEDQGTYLVQAKGAIDARFRALLQNAGGVFVSYIPNNAELVRISASGAGQLAGNPLVQAVLPYEPYYKLDTTLLKLAVEGTDLPMTIGLNLTVFSDARAATLAALKNLGAEVASEERTPFGSLLRVHPAQGTFLPVVTLPGVMRVEPAWDRMLANDLTRVRLGVTTNASNATPYLSLTGTNIVIAINDSGVDGNHPDLSGRVSGTLTDFNGHGTHVTATIIGNGSQSATVGTNASGSATGADFRGMAPSATAVVNGIGFNTRPRPGLGSPASDSALQEIAAQEGALVDNNSWNYGAAGYNINAASYDAAVRDALPGTPGSQPLLMVFSAGNAGLGGDGGGGGTGNSILSPGTAKNVITVGAIEQARNITNDVVIGTVTNKAFQGTTDSSNQVASFSSRGNVGQGIEGSSGRFKPDMVAPGTFTISAKSATWDQVSYFDPTNTSVNTIHNLSVETNVIFNLSMHIPENAVQVVVSVAPNNLSPAPFPQIPVYIGLNDIPTATVNDFAGTNFASLPPDATLNPGSTLHFSFGNPTSQLLNFDVVTLVVTTNDLGTTLTVLSNLSAKLGPFYRYESGTSMSAAAVSGTLALMQEFFTQRLNLTNSPALMKALLINGARSVAAQYDFNTSSVRNFQGWGLPSLSNSIPESLTNGVGSVAQPLQFWDQDPTNALYTGQSKTRTILLSTNATLQPLRMTLVWTDPPGNPVAGVKLVNDLDLIVTNLDTGDIFWGNDILNGSLFNQATDTNNPHNDLVNNVENVYLPDDIGTNFSVTVYARRVNVNAVTANTNGVVQDYALVISAGDNGASTNNFTVTDTPVAGDTNVFLPITINSGIPILGLHAGANSQYSTTTNGITNQWTWFVFTNILASTNASFTNVAFITFSPPNLGLTRMGARVEDSVNHAARLEADIDMYVSRNSLITNLDAAAIAAAFKSVERGGTEKVLFTDSFAGDVFYVGIKSEDQEAAEFALVGTATDQPFGQTDGQGNIILTPITPPLPALIPPGTPAIPGSVSVIMLTTETGLARKVVVTDTITHQQFGDLVGAFGHGTKRVVLNNHSFFTNIADTTETFTYDDTQELDFQPSRKSDGPGSLQDFTGDEASQGIWIFTMVNDSSPIDVGSVDAVRALVVPQLPTNSFSATIPANSWFYGFVDVPPEATNLIIHVDLTGPDVNLYVRRGAPPDINRFDALKLIRAPGDTLNLSIFDSPPLNPGRYYFGIFNPNAVQVQVSGYAIVQLTLTPDQPLKVVSIGDEPILDDAVTYSTVHVNQPSRVVSAEVGIRLAHPRVSDLVLTLVSPSGTRVVLMENRGGLDPSGLGFGANFTNVFPTNTAGDFTANFNVIATGQTSGTLIINYNFFTVPDDMRVYYDGNRIFASGLISGAGTFSIDYGPGASTDVTIVMNEGGNTDTNTAWQYNATVITKTQLYATFTDDTKKTTLPIKFAPPPFGSNVAPVPPVLIFSTGFEGAAATNYPGSGTNVFDGWTNLNSNDVIVVNVPQFADSGANVLALHHGSVSRTLPTIPGRSYTLKFANHGRPATPPVSWWKAENNFLDTADGNHGSATNAPGFALGEVGTAFNFNGVNQYIFVTNRPNLNPSGSMSLEGWINLPSSTGDYTIINKWGAGGASGNQRTFAFHTVSGNALNFSLSDASNQINIPFHTCLTPAGVIPTNAWAHVSATYDRATGFRNVYVNGFRWQTRTDQAPFDIFPGSADAAIGAWIQEGPPKSFFPGRIDELSYYSVPLTQAQVQDIYAAGSAGKCPGGCTVTGSVNLGGVNHIITGTDAWRTNVYTFNATTNATFLALQSLDDGMLFDSFQLFENAAPSPANNYLPEEPLSKLIGENSAGDWKLEIWDNRVGATNPTPNLVSWQLSLLLERLAPATIPLFHGIPSTNTIPPNAYAFYLVDVPDWALFATNILNVTPPGQVELLFNQVQLPTNTDFVMLNASGSYTLDTNGAPPLLPGERYYLAVHNTGTVAATFTVEVDFDITPLTNTIALTNGLAANNLPHYYLYDVSTNAVAVAFEVLQPTGDVTLVARRGSPLPDEFSFDYKSAKPGTNNETIIVATNSTPFPLTAGRWYLGVFNHSPTPVTYAIRATEFGPPTIIELTNGVPFTFNSDSGPALTNFFHFLIDQTNESALFELFALSGDVDLTLDRNKLPYSAPFFGFSGNPGTNNEQIVIRTNILGTDINGDWYLGVPNNTGNNVTYTIRAVLSTNGILNPGGPINVTVKPPANPFLDGPTITFPAINGEWYEIQVSSDLVAWVTVAIIQATGGTVSYTDPTPLAGQPARYYRIIQIPPPGPSP